MFFCSRFLKDFIDGKKRVGYNYSVRYSFFAEEMK